MSLNLGNDGVTAIAELRGSPAFQVFIAAFRELVRQKTNLALDATPDNAAKSMGYAQALRDVSVAIESAASGKPQQQIKAPGAVKGQ